MLIYRKNSKISTKSRIFPFSRFTNSSIGDNSYIGLFAFVNNTNIGKFCSISMSFKSGLGTHPKRFISTSPFFYKKKYALKNSLANDENFFQEYSRISIGNDVWIGTDVLIHDGVNVGNGSIIASKSVVVKDVPEYAIVGGVPAKIIKYRFSKDVIQRLKQLKWWDWETKKLVEFQAFFKKEISINNLEKLIKKCKN